MRYLNYKDKCWSWAFRCGLWVQSALQCIQASVYCRRRSLAADAACDVDVKATVYYTITSIDFPTETGFSARDWCRRSTAR